jgi:outer membrane protein OmpA-like peptidoglycan-associated protein/tetratricopeptide (TPR) repeat protein
MFVRKFTIGAMLIAASFTGSVFGQDALIKTGNHHYETLCYVKAIDAFEQALKKGKLADGDKIAAKVKLADSYCKIKDSQNAERIYREIIESGSDLSADNGHALLKYAQVLASNGKYRESQEIYDRYTRAVADDSRGPRFSKLYNDVSVLSKNAACYKVDYLSINTSKADFSPSLYKNGLVFVSGRNETNGIKRIFNWDNTSFLDLYYLDDIASINGSSAVGGGGGAATGTRSRKSGRLVGSDEYTAPTANDSRTIGTYGSSNINVGYGYGDDAITESDKFSGSLNSKYHEGPSAFLKDGSKVFFTRNNFSNGKAKKSSDGINKLKLYSADSNGDSWKNITELPFNSDEYSTGHPALSADEKLMFFVSDMPGGFGGTDVYVSRLDGSSWSAPVNLGPNVNTKGNEMFPFIDAKNNLYFSSDGHAGLGDLDIFTVAMNGAAVKGKITNLGAPINSSKDDFGVYTDGDRKVGYFSSNRKRGGNDDDIYRFTRECEVKDTQTCDLIVSVYDADTKMPLDASKVVFEDKAGKLTTKETDADGSVKLELDADNEFTFRATREGYDAKTVTYGTKDCDGEASRLEIPLSKPKKDTVKAVAPVEVATNTQTTTKPNYTTTYETTPSTGSTTYSSGGSSTYSSGGTTTYESVPYSGSTTYSNGGSYSTGTTYSSGASSAIGNGKYCNLSGRVLQQKGRQPVEGVQVTLKNECDGSTQSTVSDANGYYTFQAVGGCDYTIEAARDGMASKGKRIRRLSCDKDLNADLMMFGQGDVVEVENIYYDLDKCNIRTDAAGELNKLVSLMRRYPAMRIELRAHTDSRGDTDYNQCLSRCRARAAQLYLIKRGISKDRIEATGYGETMPVNGCTDGVECSEQQHQQNRRTEFRVIQLR